MLNRKLISQNFAICLKHRKIFDSSILSAAHLSTTSSKSAKIQIEFDKRVEEKLESNQTKVNRI